MKELCLRSVWLALVVKLSVSASAQGISPTNLQCESKSNPVGLTETSPRLSWQEVATVAGARGLSQTAYQIQVASSSQVLSNNQGDLWDTGEIATNQMTQIPYGGSTLATDEVCYWHVRVWDENGQTSAWSSPAFWSMGMLLTNEVAVSQITWGATGAFTSDAVLALAGAVSNEVYGVDFGGSGPRTTANGYRFADYSTSGNMSIAGSGFDFFEDYMTGGATTGDEALNAILTDGLYGGSGNTGTLNNLKVGQSYTVMALLDDTRGAAAGGSTFTVTDGVTTSPSQQYAFANGSPSVGGYILGTFTAGATTQSYTVNNGPNTQYNGILLESNNSAPPPTNFVLESKWTGQWIGRDDGPSYNNTNDGKTYIAATHLRKDFTLSQLPARGILYVTSLGLVEPHLNGAKVGGDYFVPGWTDYNQRVYYRAYDVTLLLQLGSNTVGAILGDGWFRGNVSILGQNFYGSTTRLCAELHLFYASGTNQVIASDGSWTAGFGPILQSDIQSGEVYNAQSVAPGWDSPGFTNASWTPVTNGATVAPVISAAPAEAVTTNQQIVPIGITQPQPGLFVVNFGQNFAGWTILSVTNQPAGSSIVMRFGEWLNTDGTVYRTNLRSAAATDIYICKGGVETWEPHFTYHGFQYLEVQGLAQAPTLGTFTGVVVHSGLTPVGSFQCSNPQINHIYSNMLWTMRANSFDIPTDCPQRDERMGWCDGTEVIRSAMFASQEESFLSKWYQDMVDGKLNTTTFPQMAPRPHPFGFASGWADCAVLLPYWLYQTYGNTRVASRFYSDMADHLQYYASTAINYIGQSGSYGDWLAVDNSTPGNLVSTAFYAGCASEMSQMAQALGKTSDAAAYGLLFTNICAAFQSNFVTTNGVVGSGSESGYVLALYFNLLTPSQRILAATNLVGAIQAQNGYISTGMVTTHWLLPTLTSIGRSDLAYQLLANTNYPSWGFWINLGATTMWEQWNGMNANGTPNTSCYNYPMDSFNHANFGTCTEWFYRGILGIDTLTPGFARILINPQPGGGLTSAQGSYDSIQGPISNAWTNTGSTFNMAVAIPPNTTAQICVPTTNASAITESGVPAASSPGVTYVGFSNNTAIYTVGSGNYIFSSPFTMAGTTSSVPRTQIVWVTNGTFSTDSVLPLAGSAANEVYGVDFGGSGAQTTSNGYTFADYATSGNMSIAGSGFGLYSAYLSGGGSTGDGALDAVLNHGLYGSSANSGTLNNLVAGQTYAVLAILADTRTGAGSQNPETAFYATDGVSDSPDQAFVFPGGAPVIGGYALGIFTAQAATQPFSLVTQELTGVYGNSQYNAILLEHVASPVIGSITISGANVILKGGNGIAGNSYTWFTTTNLMTPAASWAVCTNGTFDASGDFSNALPMNANPASYFQLRTP